MKGEFAMFTKDICAGWMARRHARPGFTLLVLFAMWLLLAALAFRTNGLLYPGLLLLLLLPVLFACVFRPDRRGGAYGARTGLRITVRDTGADPDPGPGDLAERVAAQVRQVTGPLAQVRCEAGGDILVVPVAGISAARLDDWQEQIRCTATAPVSLGGKTRVPQVRVTRETGGDLRTRPRGRILLRPGLA